MDQNCGHCGTPGSLVHVDNVRLKAWTEYVDRYGEMSFVNVVAVSRCTACEQPTVFKYMWIDDMGEAVNDQTLYPTRRDNSALPAKVRKRFDSAMKVRQIEPGLYAVGIRRMLEAVCDDQNAEGRDLFHKVKYLVEHKGLPATIADATSRLRDLGKYGAHEKEFEVASEDVPAIENLADAVLEYLYRAPATIDALTESVKARGGRLSTGG